jgi:hypothetical protein
VSASKSEVDYRLKKMERHLPRHPAKAVRWTRKDVGPWVRVPIGIVLIIAGLFGFLPILGYWMIPVGLILLAKDVRFLRGQTIWLLKWAERTRRKWKRR